MKNEELLNMQSFAKSLNDRKFTDYFRRLSLIAKAIFKWSNLPNGIDEKWIEKFLFIDGRCVFFKDEEKGFMVARCNPSGTFNNYDEPTTLRPYGTNYFPNTNLINNVDCILIRNNDDMIPTAHTIQLFAYDLASISRTIDVNINAQKTPVMIKCSDKQKLSLKNAYNQVTGNEPVIYVDKQMDVGVFEVLKTDAPIVFDKLQIQKHEIWNECMTFLGINNANMNKRERLVTSEVDANNSQIEMACYIMLKARENACKLINEKYGLDIKVEIRSQIDDVDIQDLDGEENE